MVTLEAALSAHLCQVRQYTLVRAELAHARVSQQLQGKLWALKTA